METKKEITPVDFTNVVFIGATTKEWFDRINGNSYFSAQVRIVYKDKTEETRYLPFQYGYGSHSEFEISKALGYDKHLWHYREEFGFVLQFNKIENCLKMDVVAWGKEGDRI